VDAARLEACANVYLTGNKRIAELPNYLKGMDAVLIPYKVNEATRNIYPLKLQEYLAAGKPVVSPPMPAVQQYSDVVLIAQSHEAFVTRLEEALNLTDEAFVTARQAVARENSWDRRVEEKAGLVQAALDNKRKDAH